MVKLVTENYFKSKSMIYIPMINHFKEMDRQNPKSDGLASIVAV